MVSTYHHSIPGIPWRAHLDMEVHVIKHQATENMLGISSGKILRERPGDTAELINL